MVTANYNHGQYIGMQLEAVLGQSIPPDEVIVIDDGSTDNSVEVVSAIAAKNRTVTLLQNDRNHGVVYTANRGTEVATSDVIYYAAADDFVLPGLFEKSLDMLARYPEAGICCSLRQFLGEDGVTQQIRDYWMPSEEPGFLVTEEVGNILTEFGTFINGANALYRRSALMECMPWRTELGPFIDGYVSHAIALKHGACYVPDVLASKRLTLNRFSRVGRDDPQYQHDITEFALDLMEHDGFWPKKFVREWKNARVRAVVGSVRVRLNESNNDIIRRVDLILELRSAPGAWIFRRIFKMILKLADFCLRSYTVFAYPPTPSRIWRKLTGRLRRASDDSG